MKFIKDLKTVLKDIIQSEIQKTKVLEKYIVTGTNDNQTVNIKKLNVTFQYNNVQCLGLGLSNLQGQIMIPNVGDIVLVGFLGNDTPVVLGNLFDNFSNSQDNIMPIKINEYFVTNQEKGSYMYLNKNNEFTLRASKITPLDMNGNKTLFDKEAIEDLQTRVSNLEN